jgi:hypothetical protein
MKILKMIGSVAITTTALPVIEQSNKLSNGTLEWV